MPKLLQNVLAIIAGIAAYLPVAWLGTQIGSRMKRRSGGARMEAT